MTKKSIMLSDRVLELYKEARQNGLPCKCTFKDGQEHSSLSTTPRPSSTSQRRRRRRNRRRVERPVAPPADACYASVAAGLGTNGDNDRRFAVAARRFVAPAKSLHHLHTARRVNTAAFRRREKNRDDISFGAVRRIASATSRLVSTIAGRFKKSLVNSALAAVHRSSAAAACTRESRLERPPCPAHRPACSCVYGPGA